MLASRRQPSRRADFGAVYSEVVREAPAKLRRERLLTVEGETAFDRLLMPVMSVASLSFCIFAIVTSLNDPNYYSQKLISSLVASDVDPIRTGTTVKPDGGVSLPVPAVVRAEPLKPSDYQIVMIFENEAILTTDDELMRVKVGSVLPGLGEVTSIVPGNGGGMVDTQFATLKSVPN